MPDPAAGGSQGDPEASDGGGPQASEAGQLDARPLDHVSALRRLTRACVVWPAPQAQEVPVGPDGKPLSRKQQKKLAKAERCAAPRRAAARARELRRRCCCPALRLAPQNAALHLHHTRSPP